MSFKIKGNELLQYINEENETKVVIPKGITSISDYAFAKCTNLTSITILEGVTSIGNGAFLECINLTSITIPEGVTSIGKGAFAKCTNLTSVVIPDSVTNIGVVAFFRCTNLTSITIPEGVTSIGNYAFSECTSLASITIPDSVTSIGEDAFSYCSNLKKVYVNSLSSWCNIEFGNCFANPLSNKAKLYVKGELAKGLIIPEGVKSIGEYAFFRCKNLTSITIPEGVTSIGNYAFNGCSNLKKVYINSLSSWCNIEFEDCESNPLSNGAELYVKGELVKDLIIPEGVTKIGNYTFLGTDITSVTIPDSVTSIGDYVFNCCCKLKFLSISSNLITFEGVKLAESNVAKLAKIQELIDKWIDYEKINLKVDVPLYPLCSFSDLTITQEEKATYLPELLIKCEENPQYYISYAAFADDDTVRELIKSIPVWSKGKKIDKERAFRVKGGLLLNDSIEAMKYADSINMLDHYAEIRHIDADTLRDNVISNFGLDENGSISWNVDNHIITAKLLNDLTFLLRDETGKVIKSISKKTLEGEEASKAYSALKKEIKSVAKLRNDKLLSDFLSGREREVESWSKAWLNNPLLKVLGRLVVWSQDKQTFTIHDDGLLYKADNSLYTLTNKPVCVAHPMEMEGRDLEEWRKYFNDNKLKQPFEQIWEPVTTSVKNGRYDGCTIALYCLMNKEKHGITMLSQSELRMTDCSASIKLIESHSDWINNVFEIRNFKFDKYTRAVNHIVSIFDKGTVEGRIKKDDISVEPYLERFTIAQIMKFIDIASKNNCNNVLALLMNYKNKHYSDYDPMDEFILDL